MVCPFSFLIYHCVWMCTMYVYLHICRQMCVGVCVHVYMRICTDTWSWCQVSFFNNSTLYSFRVWYWNHRLTIQLVLLASLPWGLFAITCFMVRPQMAAMHALFQIGAERIWTAVQSSGSHGKPFTIGTSPHLLQWI